jgi:phage gp29-like protein
VPYGAEVQPIEMHGQGAPFLTAFRMLDEQMTMAISGQTMTSMQPSRGTQSQGSVQEHTFETLVHQAKASVIRMVRRDILRPWMRYNHGAASETLAPKVGLGQTEQQDFTSELVALAGAGYTIDQSQFPAIDRRLGIALRAEDWQEQKQADAQKTAELAAKVKQATGVQIDTQQPTPRGPAGRPIMPSTKGAT